MKSSSSGSGRSGRTSSCRRPQHDRATEVVHAHAVVPIRASRHATLGIVYDAPRAVGRAPSTLDDERDHRPHDRARDLRDHRPQSAGRGPSRARRSRAAAVLQGRRQRYGDAPVPELPILGVRLDDLGEKEAVLAAGHRGYFTIRHFDGYAAVLIELRRAAKHVVRETLVDGWLACTRTSSPASSPAAPSARRPPAAIVSGSRW